MPLIKTQSKPLCDGVGKQPLRIVTYGTKPEKSGKKGAPKGKRQSGICPGCGKNLFFSETKGMNKHKDDIDPIDVFYLQIDALMYGQLLAIADLDDMDAADWARDILAEQMALVLQGLPTVESPEEFSDMIEERK